MCLESGYLLYLLPLLPLLGRLAIITRFARLQNKILSDQEHDREGGLVLRDGQNIRYPRALQVREHCKAMWSIYHRYADPLCLIDFPRRRTHEGQKAAMRRPASAGLFIYKPK
jgi:hypothetical protein